MEDEIKLPYVPPGLIEHLEKQYDRSNCLRMASGKVLNNDELLGLIKGIDMVIEYLKAVATEADR